VILHSVDGRHETFLCRRHAATTLSKNLDQLASAVVEMALQV
jgi:hypothetical protein